MTRRLTMAQALIEFLKNQHIERDGRERQCFGGCFGIFGHGNVAGIGQALHQDQTFPFYFARNEQAMVHSALRATDRPVPLVKTVALDHGFWHLGQFAHDYRAMYGETPSETVLRARPDAAARGGEAVRRKA